MFFVARSQVAASLSILPFICKVVVLDRGDHGVGAFGLWSVQATRARVVEHDSFGQVYTSCDFWGVSSF